MGMQKQKQNLLTRITIKKLAVKKQYIYTP